MFLELSVGAYLVGSYIYHRYIEDHPKPKPDGEVKLPRIDEGAPIPIIYGRCRVRAPILAWTGTPTATAVGDLGDPTTAGGALFLYSMNLLYVLGLTTGDTHLHHVWVGDVKLRGGDMGSLAPDTTSTVNNFTGTVPADGIGEIGGLVTWLDGNGAQDIDTTTIGSQLVAEGVTSTQVPGLRGYMSVMLFASGVGWLVGGRPQLGTYSFEASSYPLTFGYLFAEEANPASVLYDILTNPRGRLGLTTIGGGVDTTMVDNASFQAAAQTLFDEAHGYSRALEGADTADEIIQSILAQIDATLYRDMADGLIKLKLIRDDYVVADLLTIDPSNCEEVRGPAFGGWANLPNKIRVVYADRSRDYADNSVTAMNQANAVGQDGQVRELVLQYPGICTEALATQIAARELSARSRPMFKCQAVVNRDLAGLNPGDVVMFTWPEWGIAEMAMRVAKPVLGTLEDGRVIIELMQDFYYVHRGIVAASTMPAFTGGSEVLVG